MLLPEGWRVAEDHGGHIFYCNFTHYPHEVQFEPPVREVDTLLYWREILSLAEATGLATQLSGDQPLSPMPPLEPIPPGSPGYIPRGGGGGGGGRPTSLCLTLPT